MTQPLDYTSINNFINAYEGVFQRKLTNRDDPNREASKKIKAIFEDLRKTLRKDSSSDEEPGFFERLFCKSRRDQCIDKIQSTLSNAFNRVETDPNHSDIEKELQMQPVNISFGQRIKLWCFDSAKVIGIRNKILHDLNNPSTYALNEKTFTEIVTQNLEIHSNKTFNELLTLFIKFVDRKYNSFNALHDIYTLMAMEGINYAFPEPKHKSLVMKRFQKDPQIMSMIEELKKTPSKEYQFYTPVKNYIDFIYSWYAKGGARQTVLKDFRAFLSVRESIGKDEKPIEDSKEVCALKKAILELSAVHKLHMGVKDKPQAQPQAIPESA